MPKYTNVEENIKNVKASYNVQTTLEDKIYFYINFVANNTSLVAVNNEINKDNNKKALFEEADLSDRGLSEEESNYSFEIQKKLLIECIGDGTPESINKALKAFAIVRSKNAYECGLVYKEYYDKFLKENPDAVNDEEEHDLIMKKAMYMANLRQTKSSLMFSALSGFSTELYNLLGLDSNLNYKGNKSINDVAKDKIFSKLGYDKDLPMSEFVKKAGFTDYEAKLYLDTLECEPTDKVYDVFKRELQKKRQENNNQNPVTDDDVKAEVRYRFAFEVVDKCLYQNIKTVPEYFEKHYSEKLTVDYFISLMNYNKDEKNNFFNEFNCKADDLLSTVIKKLLTVEDYMNANQMSEQERNEFLASYNVKKEDRLPDDLDLTDDDVKLLGCVYLDNKLSEKDQTYMNSIQYKTTNGFIKQFDVFADKKTYEIGKKFVGLDEAPEAPVDSSITKEKLISKYKKKGLGDEKAAKKADADIRFRDFCQNEAKVMMQDALVKDIKDSYEETALAIYSKTPLKFHEDPKVRGFLDSTVIKSNTTFLHGAIVAFEATGTGKKYTNSDKARSSNSTKYEEMLKALKDYYNKTADEDNTGIERAKNTLKEKCINYISGKESVRKREFGRKRFDIAMAILSDVMTTSDFKGVVNRINRKRGVTNKPEHEDYVTVKSYQEQYGKLFSAEETEEENRQLTAEEKYATRMPDEYKERFESVLNLYDKDPKMDNRLSTVLNNGELNNLHKIEDEFVPIGKGLKERKLSDYDFAAIAYAGALIPESADVDTRYNVSVRLALYKPLMVGKDYTLSVFDEPIKDVVKDCMPSIENGRQQASQALKDYANGDKNKLIYLMAYGIRGIAAMCREKKTIDDSFYCSAEIGQRLLNILDRDPELKQKIFAKTEDYLLIKEDVDYIKTINNCADIYKKAGDAERTLQNDNGALNRNQKTDLITDIVMLKVLNESKKQYQKFFETSKRYKNKILEVDKDYKYKLKCIMEKPITEEYSIADREKDFKKLENDRLVGKISATDYYHDDKMFTSLNNKKFVDSLRNSVKDLVKDSGLAKLAPAQILNRLSSEKLLQKLAVMTGKVNDKASSDFVNRVENTKKEVAAKKAAAQAVK